MNGVRGITDNGSTDFTGVESPGFPEKEAAFAERRLLDFFCAAGFVAAAAPGAAEAGAGGSTDFTGVEAPGFPEKEAAFAERRLLDFFCAAGFVAAAAPGAAEAGAGGSTAFGAGTAGVISVSAASAGGASTGAGFVFLTTRLRGLGLAATGFAAAAWGFEAETTESSGASAEASPGSRTAAAACAFFEGAFFAGAEVSVAAETGSPTSLPGMRTPCAWASPAESSRAASVLMRPRMPGFCFKINSRPLPARCPAVAASLPPAG
jgi:hypothetical protein